MSNEIGFFFSLILLSENCYEELYPIFSPDNAILELQPLILGDLNCNAVEIKGHVFNADIDFSESRFYFTIPYSEPEEIYSSILT